MLKEHQAGLYSMHCSASQTEFEGKGKIFTFSKISFDTTSEAKYQVQRYRRKVQKWTRVFSTRR